MPAKIHSNRNLKRKMNPHQNPHNQYSFLIGSQTSITDIWKNKWQKAHVHHLEEQTTKPEPITKPGETRQATRALEHAKQKAKKMETQLLNQEFEK